MAEPFSATELTSFVTALEIDTQFQRWHNEFLPNWDGLRWRTAPVNIPGISEKLEYHTPAVGSNVDRYRNRLRAAEMRAKVAAKDPKSRPAAQRAENFFHALYTDFRRQGDADDRALDLQTAKGLGPRRVGWTDNVLGKLFDKDMKIDDLSTALSSVFKDGFQGNPFKLYVPDLTALFWDRNMSMVAEIGPVQLTSVRLAYEEDLDGDDKVAFEELVSDVLDKWENETNPDRTVPFWHVETNKYIYEAIANENSDTPVMLRVYPNPVGRPGYTFAAGHKTSGMAPWQAYKPLVGDLFEPAQHLNINRTLLSTAALQTGRPRYQSVKDGGKADDYLTVMSRPADDENVISVDSTSELASMPERPGRHWEPVQIPDTSILQAAVEANERDLKEYGFPSSLDPSASSSATSGYDRALEQQGAADFLDPPLANNATAWQLIFLQVADAIIEIGLPVTIRTLRRAEGEDQGVQDEVRIEPDDFKDIHLEVEFTSTTATTQFALDASSREDVALGYKSKTTYMSEKFPDPIREQEQVDLDRMADAASKLAFEVLIGMLRARTEPMLSQIQAQEGVPPVITEPEGEGFEQSRPEGGSFPGEGAPAAPPRQAQTAGQPPAAAVPSPVGGTAP